jgi:Holliday junction resolvasome RuvABC ATP-dependent DNA helicase subunit
LITKEELVEMVESMGVDVDYAARQLVGALGGGSSLAAQDRIRRALEGLRRVQEAAAVVAEAELDAELADEPGPELDVREHGLLCRLRRMLTGVKR